MVGGVEPVHVVAAEIIRILTVAGIDAHPCLITGAVHLEPDGIALGEDVLLRPDRGLRSGGVRQGDLLLRDQLVVSLEHHDPVISGLQPPRSGIVFAIAADRVIDVVGLSVLPGLAAVAVAAVHIVPVIGGGVVGVSLLDDTDPGTLHIGGGGDHDGLAHLIGVLVGFNGGPRREYGGGHQRQNHQQCQQNAEHPSGSSFCSLHVQSLLCCSASLRPAPAPVPESQRTAFVSNRLIVSIYTPRFGNINQNMTRHAPFVCTKSHFCCLGRVAGPPRDRGQTPLMRTACRRQTQQRAQKKGGPKEALRKEAPPSASSAR